VAEGTGIAGRSRRRKRLLRASILDLYLIRGVTVPLLLITAVACLAMMLERALRLVQEMAASGAHLGYFLPLLWQLLPYYVGLALPAAFLIALILLMTRMDESLELEAILASGVSFARIAAPLVLVGIAVAGASVAASGFLEPHGRYAFRSLKKVAINAGRIPQLQPGAFYSPASGLTLGIDRVGGDGRSLGIFVRQRLDGGREMVATARDARIALVAGDRELEIEMGPGLHLRDSIRPGGRPFVLSFDGYTLREPLLRDDPKWARGSDAKEMTVAELIAARRSPDRRIDLYSLDAELLSRLARSLTIPLLPLLALPLAFGPKRTRRSVGIVIGFVVLMAFNHGLNFAKNLGFDGAADPRFSIGLITAGFAAAIVWLFAASRHLPSHSPVATPLRRAAALFARLPRRRGRSRRWGGRMGLYIARLYLGWTFAAAAVIVLLLQMVDIFDLGDAFVERGFGWPEIGRYAWLRLPPLLQQSIGLASLAGAIMAFLRLSRFSEMVAMRGAGVSQYRLLAMALPAAGALALASFAAAEYLAPRAQLELAQWWRAGDPAARGDKARERWFRIGGDLVRASGASPDGRRLEAVAIYIRDGDGLLEERIAARAAVPARGGWRLIDAVAVRPRAGPAGAAPQLWRTNLRSEDVRAFFAAPPQLSAETARRSLEDRMPVNTPPSVFRTRLQRQFAEPLAPIVMLLIALPLAFSSARSGPTWRALLYAIGAGLLFVVVDGTLVVIAQIGMIDPWVGSWAAPLLFGLLAVTVLVYTER
jgi:lipopolysaccharide export system permease protein